MWIQLLQPKTIDRAGVNTRFNTGDWVDVGKHTALLWISDGTAHIPEMAESGFDLSGSGILTDHKELLCTRLKDQEKNLSIVEGLPCIPFDKTIIR